MPFADTVLKILEKPFENGVDITATQTELFDLLCDASMKAVPDALRSSVRIFQEGKAELCRFVTVCGDWPKAKLEGVLEIDKDSVGAYSIQCKKPVVINEAVQQNPHCRDSREILSDVRSHASFPILSRNLNAVVSIDSKRENAFDIVLINTLEFMAAKTAWVLDFLAQQVDLWLLELERSCSYATSRDGLCWQALEGTVKIFGVRGGSLFLWDEERQALICAATIPKKDEISKVPHYKLGDGLTGWVAKYKSTVRLHDAESDEERMKIHPDLKWANRFSELPDASDVVGRRTFLAAPLVVQTKLIGVIRLTIKQNYADFSANDEMLLESLARHLALVIQNMRHHEDSERRRRQLEIFDELSRQDKNRPDVESLARVIFRKGMEILRCDEGHVRVYNRRKRTLDLVACEGTHCNSLEKVRPLGKGVSGRVALTRVPLVFEDIKTDPQFQSLLEEDPELLKRIATGDNRTEACYPLACGDNIIGTLSFHWTEAARVGEEEKALFQRLVDRGALALEAALAFRDQQEELDRQTDALRRLNAAGSLFVQNLDVDTLLSQFLQAALYESGISSGTVRTLSGTGDSWQLRVAVEDTNRYPRIDQCLREELPASLGLLRKAANTHDATRIFDTHVDPVFQEFKSFFPVKSCHREYLETIASILIAPMWMGNECKGLIFLCSHEPNDLPDKTVRYLQIIAAQAAIAVHDAQLLADKDRLLQIAQPLAMIGIAQGGFQHVVGSSLQALRGIIDVLEHPKFKPEMMSVQIRELSRVVDKLAQYRLDVVEFLKTPMTSIREPVNVNSLIERAMDEHSTIATSVVRDKRLSPGLPKTRGNYLLIQLAFSMVVDNALDAMPNGGMLAVESFRGPQGIHIRFKDTGTGMDETIRERAGKVFFTTKEHGTGLGLAIVDHVVRRHGGSWGILASAPGEGTLIEICLPAMEGTDNATSARG